MSEERGSAAALMLLANFPSDRQPQSELVMPLPAIAHLRASSDVAMPRLLATSWVTTSLPGGTA
jgi:hypothetical protein